MTSEQQLGEIANSIRWLAVSIVFSTSLLVTSWSIWFANIHSTLRYINMHISWIATDVDQISGPPAFPGEASEQRYVPVNAAQEGE